MHRYTEEKAKAERDSREQAQEKAELEQTKEDRLQQYLQERDS